MDQTKLADEVDDHQEQPDDGNHDEEDFGDFESTRSVYVGSCYESVKVSSFYQSKKIVI